MPASTNPIFIASANLGTARLNAFNTGSDGAGTVYTLTTSSISGSRVDGVRFRNSAPTTGSASTAMVHRIFYSPTNQSGSATSRLVGEIATAAATRNISTIGATSIYTFDLPLLMPSGSGLFVCQSAYAGVQDQFDAQAFGGNYV